MTDPDVVLRGYYGRANFGDDVLMVVAFGVVRKAFPHATIAIRMDPEITYPDQLLGLDIVRLPFGGRGRHGMILHGGGGTYFDFEPHGWRDRFRNRAMLAAGRKTFARMEKALRRLVSRERPSAKHRIGMGLGIGTYTAGSPRQISHLPELMDFERIWVRDPASAENLKCHGIATPAVLGSDLAFLWDHWCDPDLVLSPRPRQSSMPNIGIILRDWPPGGDGRLVEKMARMIDGLSEAHNLHLISFDAATDAQVLEKFAHLPQTIWQPERMSLSDFAKTLAAQDCLVTARAHGAICGAIVGRTSVIVRLEPKLDAVHAMLPNSTKLVEPDISPDGLSRAIAEALLVSNNAISEDVRHNRGLSEAALLEVLDGITL